ncbi:hypothetical protein J6590_090545, partial [Homalodisca vitripennis]
MVQELRGLEVFGCFRTDENFQSTLWISGVNRLHKTKHSASSSVLRRIHPYAPSSMSLLCS